MAAQLVERLEEERPRVSPMWFSWDGAHLRFTHTSGRKKYAQVRADPRLAVSILDPENPYRFLEIGELRDRSERVILVARPTAFRRHP